MLGKQTRKSHSEVIGIMFTRCGAGLLSEPLARIGARYILLKMLELSKNVFFCSDKELTNVFMFFKVFIRYKNGTSQHFEREFDFKTFIEYAAGDM